MIWQSGAVSLVSSAIKGKYGADSAAIVERRMSELLPLFESAQSEAELRSQLAAPHSVEQDVGNQLIVLALIERWWSKAGHPGIGIGEMHRVLFGDEAVDDLRDEDLISDFGGRTLTPWREVSCRIDEVERACRTLREAIGLSPLLLQAQFLAYAFSSIIRVHPFPDGNGRTARMYVQYLLRSWDYSYITIPKVRNDDNWRVALERAMAGDTMLLTRQIAQRLGNADVA